MMRSVRKLWGNKEGAVAPIVALSLTGLVAAGGIAFDYARMASMHTELQDAADQAALAAASQLDGQPDACARAAAAASNLLANDTRFANDGLGSAVTVTKEGTCDSSGSIQFYKAYDQRTDLPGAGATTDADAKFVIVKVDARTAKYALTPITGVFNSGAIAATAVATLGSGAICKVPPLMICNPTETATNLAFDPSLYIGKGLKLEAGGGGTWAPGNYGYLDFGNGAKTVEAAMGSNVENDPCVLADTVDTKPGNTAPAPNGINTRFDIYENGLVAYCDPSSGNCSPGIDTIKDVIHPQFSSGAAPNEIASNADNCGLGTGNDPWKLPAVAYLPDPTTRLQPTSLGAPTSMGLPRDICHAISSDGDCAKGRFGDGNWDRNLYFQVNYGTAGVGWKSLAWLTSWATANSVNVDTISRYDVYLAEVAAIQSGTLRNLSGTDATRRLAETSSGNGNGGGSNGKGNGKGGNGNGGAGGGGGGGSTDYYQYSSPRCAIGRAASSTVKDRRVVTAAVVNCLADDVKGASHVRPIGWVDMFLVEPSVNRGRTQQSQIYVEIEGGAKKPDGSSAFQYYLRERPMLIK